MASTLGNLSLSTTPSADVLATQQKVATRVFFFPAARCLGGFAVRASGPSTPPGISNKVSESIKQAEEACKDETATGECAAAWDEVEELSAAASHARHKANDNSNPLENYCKENPEANECRTYDN